MSFPQGGSFLTITRGRPGIPGVTLGACQRRARPAPARSRFALGRLRRRWAGVRGGGTEAVGAMTTTALAAEAAPPQEVGGEDPAAVFDVVIAAGHECVGHGMSSGRGGTIGTGPPRDSISRPAR